MLLEAALFADLSTYAGVTAIAGARGYPELIPEASALPAWAYQVIGSNRLLVHSGPTGLTTKRIQITAQAATYADAKALAEAIRARVNGYRGTLGGSVTIYRALVDNDQDGLADEDGATVRMDLEIDYREV